MALSQSCRELFVFVFSQLAIFHKHSHFSNFRYFSYMCNLSRINRIGRTFYYDYFYFIFILAVSNDNQRRRMILPGCLGIVGLVTVTEKKTGSEAL